MKAYHGTNLCEMTLGLKEVISLLKLAIASDALISEDMVFVLFLSGLHTALREELAIDFSNFKN